MVAPPVLVAAPTTIETYRSVLASYLRSATTSAAPTLTDFTLLQVRGKGRQRQRVKWRTVGKGVRTQRAVQQYAIRHRPPAIPVGEDRVFLTRHGRRMTRNAVHRFVKRLGRLAGVEWTHPHLVRHPTGVASYAAGARRACCSGSFDTLAVLTTEQLCWSV